MSRPPYIQRSHDLLYIAHTYRISTTFRLTSYTLHSICITTLNLLHYHHHHHHPHKISVVHSILFVRRDHTLFTSILIFSPLSGLFYFCLYAREGTRGVRLEAHEDLLAFTPFSFLFFFFPSPSFCFRRLYFVSLFTIPITLS